MSKYDINFKRLAVMLIPPKLRSPLLIYLSQAMVSPLGYTQSEFMQYREAVDYRLNHNGQVCYLRGALNDIFDYSERRITVTDIDGTGQALLVYKREESRAILVPMRISDQSIRVNRRGFGGIDGLDFVVNIPAALIGINEGQVRALVNRYKLASKRYAISYYY